MIRHFRLSSLELGQAFQAMPPMWRWVCIGWMVLLLWLGAGMAWGAGNEPVNTLPDANTSLFRTNSRTYWQDELPDVYARTFGYAWVYSGGYHPAVAGCTSGTFTTEGFTTAGNRVRATEDLLGGSATINYTALGCNCAGTDTAWVILSGLAGNATANFTRASGTNYFVDCTSATKPALPADSVWLMQVPLAAGAVGTPTDLRTVHMVAPVTISASRTTGNWAPWIFNGPDTKVTVAAGQTLTLGTCPVAGRYQIFDADESTTGTVRMANGACTRAMPEWWGTSATTLQLAANAMTTHGGVVDMAAVTYTQNTTTAKSNVVYEGKGMGATIWALTDTQNNWMYGQGDPSTVVTDNQVVHCGINNLTMDGNWSNNLTGSDARGAIAARGFGRCHFHHIHIKNARGDGVGTLVRTQDSVFEDLYIDFTGVTSPYGRSCVGISGGSLRNVFQNIVCVKPENTCLDIEPVDGVSALWDMHLSENKIHNWSCVTPTRNGFTSTMGPAVAAGFTGTRRGNIWSNLTVYRAGKHGFLIADLNENHMSNLVAIESSHLEASGRGIWIGGYSTIGATNVSLTGCNIRNTGLAGFGGTSPGLYIADGDLTAVVNHVAVSGCVVTGSDGYDLVTDAVTNLSMSGVVASKVSINANAVPISISTQGQGPALASAAILTPLGLYDTYTITGTTTINEITKLSGWNGRTIRLTFDANVIIAHDTETTETPIYLAHQSNATFCVGDTLTLKKIDVTVGDTRWQEVARSRADVEVEVTSGTTPSIACSTQMRLNHAAPTNITTLDGAEANVIYTLHCPSANATLLDVSAGGNFNLMAGASFVCSADDTIQVIRRYSSLQFFQVAPAATN